MGEGKQLDWNKYIGGLSSRRLAAEAERVNAGGQPQIHGQISAMLPAIQAEIERIEGDRANSLDSMKGIILSLLALLEEIISTRNMRDAAAVSLEATQAELLEEYIRISNLEQETQTDASQHQLDLVARIMRIVRESITE